MRVFRRDRLSLAWWARAQDNTEAIRTTTDLLEAELFPAESYPINGPFVEVPANNSPLS